MPRVLHLLKADSDIARAAIGAAVADGDTVTVALLPGADAVRLPASVTVRRVPDETSWEELIDLIFEAESVIAW
jgi:hypothetical protein